MDKSQLFDIKTAAIWLAGPDPDAIGSAVGLQWLLKQKGITASIHYKGVVSHPQNRTMLNLLNIKMASSEEDYDPEAYHKTFCVDCVPHMLDHKIDVIIDHHIKNLKSDKGFAYVDMRPTGSCASIVYDWIKDEGLVEALGEDEEATIAATALLLGVFNDTDSLTSEDIQELDFEAYRELHKYCDLVKVKSILAYPIPKYFLDLERESAKPCNTEVINTTHISCVGHLSAGKRDILANLSDKYVRLEGISTSIVFGIVEGHLEGCCRSSDVSLNLHEFTQKIFGRDYSGGKFSKSAGKVPLGFLADDDSADQDVRDKVLEAVKAKVIALVRKEIE